MGAKQVKSVQRMRWRARLHERPEGSRTGPPASGSAKRQYIPGGTGPFPGACSLNCMPSEHFRIFCRLCLWSTWRGSSFGLTWRLALSLLWNCDSGTRGWNRKIPCKSRHGNWTTPVTSCCLGGTGSLAWPPHAGQYLAWPSHIEQTLSTRQSNSTLWLLYLLLK